MRKKLFILLPFLIFGCSPGKPDCESVHDGTFLMPEPGLGNCKIERHDGKQIEESPAYKCIVDVDWIDECTYVLKNKVLLRGDERFKPTPGTQMTVEITEVTKDSVFFRFSSNQRAGSISAAMKILD